MQNSISKFKLSPGRIILIIVGVVVLISLTLSLLGTGGRQSAVMESLDHSEAVYPASAMEKSISTGEYDKPAAPFTGTAQQVSWGAAYASSPGRMVISNANASLEVPDVDETCRRIEDIALRYGGFVTVSSITSRDDYRTGSVSIRIPSRYYRTALNDVLALGKILSRDEKGNDVTEEFVDLQSRVRNLKRQEEQLLEIMGRAKKVSEVLEVQSQISAVRDQIERTTGRINYLQDQVSYSTINISINTPVQIPENAVKWDFARTAKDAFKSLSALGRVISSMLIWLLVYSPVWIIAIIAFAVIKRALSRRRG